MSISVSNAVQTPEVPEETWTAYTAVVKGKGSKLAAVFQLSPDESKIEVKAIVDNADGNWDEFVEQFDPQQIAWAVILFPYTTTSNGIRSKLIFATWVPDTLKRGSFKETIRLKSSAIFFGGELKKAAARDGAKQYQANGPSDLGVRDVLSTVSKFEHDSIDMASINRLSASA